MVMERKPGGDKSVKTLEASASRPPYLCSSTSCPSKDIRNTLWNEILFTSGFRDGFARKLPQALICNMYLDNI